MVSHVEKLGPISETVIGVFCDNIKGHQDGQLAELGRVMTPIFSRSNTIVDGPGVNTLRLLTEHHLASRPTCAGSISYSGNVGSYPVKFILPK